jgi:hypothetical protein
MVDGFGPYYLDKRKELHIFMTVLIPLDEKVIISWTYIEKWGFSILNPWLPLCHRLLENEHCNDDLTGCK